MYSPKPKFSPPLSWFIKRSQKERALKEWRRIDLVEQEKAARNNAKSANVLVSGALKTIGLDQRRSHLEVLKVWNNLLDPAIVAHAQPTGLVKGTLFVNVDSSPWLDEIVRYRRKEILARLQYSFGPDLITRISFRIG
jgi:hypothetical protein